MKMIWKLVLFKIDFNCRGGGKFAQATNLKYACTASF